MQYKQKYAAHFQELHLYPQSRLTGDAAEKTKTSDSISLYPKVHLHVVLLNCSIRSYH